MTIAEALQLVDTLRPNQFDSGIKKKWLSQLDGMIYEEVFKTHVDNPVEAFDGYDDADESTELLVPFPYDHNVYINYLQAQIDKENGEFGKYNQTVTIYNGAYRAFTDWYNRTHAPLPAESAFLF